MNASNTIVLDFDRSIHLGEKYWASLQESTRRIWGQILAEESTEFAPLLGCSLLYYLNNADSVLEQDSLLKTVVYLERSQKEMVYDYMALGKLVDSGFEAPTDVELLRAQADSALVGDAMNLIKRVWPAAYEEIKVYLSGFVMFSSERILSLTTPSWFGAVFLSTRILKMNSVLEVATAIIHEIGHMVLFADSAINSPLHDLKEKFYSPLVSKDRPALMVIHAQMAMARIVIWLHHLQVYMEKGLADEYYQERVSKEELQNEIKKYKDCYVETMPSVRKLALTDHGKALLNDFEKIYLVMNAK